MSCAVIDQQVVCWPLTLNWPFPKVTKHFVPLTGTLSFSPSSLTLTLNWHFPKVTKYFFYIMPSMGTTSYSAYLLEPLQLNGVDVLFTFNFDLHLKLRLSQGHKDLAF